MAAADTISAPWTPASSGPPPDANGSGSDTKNLDVGEISDVSRKQVYSLPSLRSFCRQIPVDAYHRFFLFFFCNRVHDSYRSHWLEKLFPPFKNLRFVFASSGIGYFGIEFLQISTESCLCNRIYGRYRSVSMR